MKKILISILMSSLLWGCAHVNGLTMPAANRTCPDDFPIKGNADSYIYHTYDSPHYQMVNPEVCFANEERAKYYGYRKFKKWTQYSQ